MTAHILNLSLVDYKLPYVIYLANVSIPFLWMFLFPTSKCQVVPLAIKHYDDSVLVASCSFLLELCGLTATLLRVDVAVLRRVSSYYDSIRHNAHYGHVLLSGSAIHVVSHEGDIILSLVQALADNFSHHDHLNIFEHRHGTYKASKGKKPPLPLMTVLQHLEKASMPLIDEGKTCGYWLSSGIGDGYGFRSQQKDASRHWNLVTEFCHMHHIPLSTKYLALLARDNDWVHPNLLSFPFTGVQ